MKRLNTEGVTRTSLNIMNALNEATEVKVEKKVMFEGACAPKKEKMNVTKKAKKEKMESAGAKKIKVTKELEDTDELGKKKVMGEEEVPVEEGAFEASDKVKEDSKEKGLYTEEAGVREMTDKLIASAEDGSLSWETLALMALKYMSEEDVADMARTNELFQDDEIEEAATTEPTAPVENEVEEVMVEGLKTLKSAKGNYLLKESNGFIVGKNYNKKTGEIELIGKVKSQKLAEAMFTKAVKTDVKAK